MMLQDELQKPRPLRTCFRPLSSQARFNILTISFGVGFVVIFVGIFVTLLVLHARDTQYERDMRTFEYTIAEAAIVPFRSVMVSALGITRGLEGYVMSGMKVLPNLSAPPLQRLQGQNFPLFDKLCSTMDRNSSYIPVTSLLPGGVYAFAWPPNAFKYGTDSLAPHSRAQGFLPTPQQTIDSGAVDYVGPFRSITPTLYGDWGLEVRLPIFNRTSYAVTHQSAFWGFASVLVNISGILEQENPFDLSAYTRGKGYWDFDYILCSLDRVSAEPTVVATSLRNPTPKETAQLLQLGTSMRIQPSDYFVVSVRGRHHGEWLSSRNIIVVIVSFLLGVFLLLIVGNAAILWCTQEYHGAAHAPKLAPFAMLTIGLSRGEELWDLAPEEMAEATERLSGVLERQMVLQRAYQIHQVHPLTTSYVTRSVAAAVQLAFGTIAELQRHPIDGPLRRLLGDEDGCLALSCAVHWCTDAAVRVESLEGSYRYEGPDVVFGGRMWAFAPPGAVTASAAVVSELPCFGMRYLKANPICVVDVVRSRTLCTTVDSGLISSRSGGTAGRAATIYVPPSPPTGIQSIVNLCNRDNVTVKLCEGNAGSKDPKLLSSQTLYTIFDPRRPTLVAPAATPQCPISNESATPLLPTTSAVPVINVPPRERWTTTATSFSLACDAASASAAGLRSGISGALSLEAAAVDGMSGERSASPLTMGAPNVLDTDNAGLSHATSSTVALNPSHFQGDAITRALLSPLIPRSLDVALNSAFDYQSITLDIDYRSVRVLVYYFNFSYKLLFRPLAAPELQNIFRRLVSAFGVPQQGLLEHLAARCVIRFLQHNAKTHHLPQRQWRVCLSRSSGRDTPLPCVSGHDNQKDAAF